MCKTKTSKREWRLQVTPLPTLGTSYDVLSKALPVCPLLVLESMSYDPLLEFPLVVQSDTR